VKLAQVWTDSEVSYTGVAELAGRAVVLSAERLGGAVVPEQWLVRATCERGTRRLNGHRRYRAEIDHVPSRERAVALLEAAAAAVVALASTAGDA
jgi:hypothetical protein